MVLEQLEKLIADISLSRSFQNILLAGEFDYQRMRNLFRSSKQTRFLEATSNIKMGDIASVLTNLEDDDTLIILDFEDLPFNEEEASSVFLKREFRLTIGEGKNIKTAVVSLGQFNVMAFSRNAGCAYEDMFNLKIVYRDPIEKSCLKSGEFTEGRRTTMGISDSQIYEGRDAGRPVNLAGDIDQLWDDTSVLKTLVSTRAYVSYIINQFQHEDFERDACDPFFVTQDGPYADILNDVSREMEGEEDPDWIPTFDSLAQFMISSDSQKVDGEWVDTGIPKYVSEEVLKEYFFRYLDALKRSVTHDEEWNDIPDDLMSNFKSIMKLKIYETLIALAK